VLISKLSPFFKAFDVDLLLYLMIFFAPRLFLLVLLINDIFYYNCISFFYSYAYVGLIPQVIKYYIYVIRSLNEEYLEYLDECYYVDEMQSDGYKKV
jgi:hypothetical protein